MSIFSALSLTGESSCTKPVTAPLMPRSDGSSELTMDRSNLSRLNDNMSPGFSEALPWRRMDCSPEMAPKESMLMLPLCMRMSEGWMLHSLVLYCSEEGMMRMSNILLSSSREMSPLTMNSPFASLSLWLSKEYPVVFSYGGTQNATLYVNEDVFNVCDLGYRRSGEKTEIKVYGESADAALIKTSDGIYITDDGRLQTKLDEAMVIRNGESAVTKAQHQIRDSKVGLLVEFYYRDEGFYLEKPKYYSITGDIYRMYELL